MGYIELEKEIDQITDNYCHLLSSARTEKEKKQLFKTFYETLLIIEKMKFEEVKYDRKASKLIG